MATECAEALAAADRVLISAGTMAEALIVATHRELGPQMQRLIDDLNLEVVPVTAATAFRVAQAHTQWGKGVHPAALNFGDCFAYTVASQNKCPLLCVGEDFVRTDIPLAL